FVCARRSQRQKLSFFHPHLFSVFLPAAHLLRVPHLFTATFSPFFRLIASPAIARARSRPFRSKPIRRPRTGRRPFAPMSNRARCHRGLPIPAAASFQTIPRYHRHRSKPSSIGWPGDRPPEIPET